MALKIKVLHLRGKSKNSRKGDHIQIQDNGVKRLYKFDGYPIDVYVEAFQQRVDVRLVKRTYDMRQSRSRGSTEDYDKIQRIMRSLKSKGMLDAHLRSGVTEVTFNPHDLTPDNIPKLYRKLLRPLVYDDQILDEVIKIAPKFKHRFFYTTVIVTGKREDGVVFYRA